MYRFYDSVIKPLLDALEPKVIVEIGSQQGLNTEKLLRYCQGRQSTLHTIDPSPEFDVEAWQNEFGECFVLHKALSLNALPKIDAIDIALIDGDHNWYTVYNELKLLELQSGGASGTLPVIIFHDVGWPYGRRDLYYNPDNIPDEFRKPYKKLGLMPGCTELLEKGGMNRHLCNSIYEHNLQNGVLTAIEDFIKESDQKLRFVSIRALSGLGILAPASLVTTNIPFRELLDSLSMRDTINNIMGKLEIERIEIKIKLEDKIAQHSNYKKNQEELVEKVKQSNEDSTARLAESEKALSRNKKELAQQKVLLGEREVLLGERDEALEQSRRDVNKLDHELAHQKVLLGEREVLLGERDETLEQSRRDVNKLEDEIAQQKALVGEHEEALERSRTDVVRLDKAGADAQKELTQKQILLARYEALLSQLQDELGKSQASAVLQRKLLAERDDELEQQKTELAKKTEEFAKTRKYLEQDLAATNTRLQDTLHSFNENAATALAKQVEKNENDVRLLYSWVEALHEAITQIEGIAWWRLGMALRRVAGALHILNQPRFAGTEAAPVIKAAHTRRKSALERLKHIEKEKHPDRLFVEHIRLFSQWIDELFDIISRIERTSFWRMGVRLRRLAGILRLKPRNYELATDRAKAIIISFREWQRKPNYAERYVPVNAPSTTVAQAQALLPDKERRHFAMARQPSSNIKENSVFHRSMANVLPHTKGTRFEKAYLESEDVIESMVQQSNWPSGRPLVSIIMPAYNRADIITDAIQSVCEQTYPNWELLVCDDGSDDNTEAVVAAIDDPRIAFLNLPHQGAAKARNCGLERAQGEYIAYLDSDNVWHPGYLDVMVGTLAKRTGHYTVFAKYIDVVIKGETYTVRRWNVPEFNYEELAEKNFIDLNSFVHRAVTYKHLAGFTDSLERQQDWDLVLKHTYLRDPLYVDAFVTFYRRNDAWNQLTTTKKAFTKSTRATVLDNLGRYYEKGLPAADMNGKPRKVTIVSWDICRNHFSKAYNLAESLARSGQYDVQLVGFRFFETRIFEPYQDEKPSFETVYIDACEFPDFEQAFTKALISITGDVVYCVKPRLPSLGLGLMANYHFGKPVIMEANDSEMHITRPQKDKETVNIDLDSVNMADKELLTPYSLLWSQIIDEFAKTLPWITTHNKNLDRHYGARAFYIRNLKDQEFYDPARYDRDQIRAELGFKPTDRVILFGGLLRKHKGIYELIDLVKKMRDNRYKVLFVASRNSFDQQKIAKEQSDTITVLPPQGRNYMAQINYAADLVVLWLDPEIPASHYQMPYKFTDAIAMKVPVIANDISDLGDLGHQGYLSLVDFGDFKKLQKTVTDIFDNPDKTSKRVEAARKLYLRQFSYRAAKSNFDMLYDTAMLQNTGTLPAAQAFAEFFGRFHQALGVSRIGGAK